MVIGFDIGNVLYAKLKKYKTLNSFDCNINHPLIKNPEVTTNSLPPDLDDILTKISICNNQVYKDLQF